MGAGTLVFDDTHIFEGEAVYERLKELDAQKQLDTSRLECQACRAVTPSEGLDPGSAACPQCGAVGEMRPYTRPGLLMRIGEYLRTFDPITMIIEENVVDEEYFREFLYFYATTFWENPPATSRLHFFASSQAEVEARLDPSETLSWPPVIRDAGYIGYVVPRPTEPSTVGETLLSPPDTINTETCYVSCAAQFGQTVAGRRLQVHAAPFIGQDQQTGVCAHSAIWGAVKYLHKYRYYEKLSMPDIALRAGRLYPAARYTRPSRELESQAMYAVLQDLGLNVHLEKCEPDSQGRCPGDPMNAIYLAVESGLPALLHLMVIPPGEPPTGHAVWVCGHTLGDLPDRERKRQSGRALFETLREPVTRLLVNDDNTGPYMPATVERAISPGTPPIEFYNLRYDGHSAQSFHDPLLSPEIVRLIANVFVPLPAEVFVLPHDLRRLMGRVLGGHYVDDLLLALSGEAPRKSELVAAALISLRERIENREVLIRTYLCMSDRYREWAACFGACDRVRELYTTGLALPEYIWVVELLDKQLAGVADPGEAVIGELLLDSTDSLALVSTEAPRYLALHVPGLLLYNPSIEAPDVALSAASAGELRLEVLPSDESPYGCFKGNTEPPDEPRSHRKLGPIV